jgi:Gpi18-like mannosyltransferase
MPLLGERQSNHLNVIFAILMMIILSRGMIYLTGYLGMNLFSDNTQPSRYEMKDYGTWKSLRLILPERVEETKVPGIKDLQKLDAVFYLKIAEKGYDTYQISEKHPTADWVFFPLYPLLIKAFHSVLFFLDKLTVSVILSNLFLFAALIYIYLICQQKGFDRQKALLVIFFILIYPSSLFFSVPYTESLFLLLSAATLYHTQRRQYALAFILAGLSLVTRVPGFINLLFVIGSLLLDKKWAAFKQIKFYLYGMISLVPLAAYLYHMKVLTGDFLAPLHEQSISWHRGTTIPFMNYFTYLAHPYFNAPGGWDIGPNSFLISTAVLFVYAGYFILYFRALIHDKQALLFYVYGALLILVPFASAAVYMTSVVRYMMVCVPLYLYLVSLASRFELGKMAYVILFVTFNTLTTIGYFNHYYFVV